MHQTPSLSCTSPGTARVSPTAPALVFSMLRR
jgi:hypothetical protein